MDNDSNLANVLAVDIGGSRFRVGLFDREGRRLRLLEGDTVRSGGRDWMLKEVQNRCRALLDKSGAPVKACGVSFGGPVDFRRQLVRSIHSPGWEDFKLAHWVEETFNLPCRVDNDANCGALGEYRFGAARGAKSVVYITLSTGIGGGLVLDGKVHRGKDSLAGELGHMRVSDTDTPCSCGARGCLEAFCSGIAIATRAQELATRRPEGAGRMAELSASPENISARAVYQAAAEGELAAVQIVSEASRWLARAVLILIRTLDPDKIVLGGGVTAAGNMFLLPVQGFLREFSASSSIGFSTEVELAELGQYSPLYGAAALALELLC